MIVTEEKMVEIRRSGIRRDLLSILHREKLNTSELARRLNISRQLADYHLKQMEKAGVVKRCRGIWEPRVQQQ